MDPQTTMEAVTEGAKALTKFQEIIQKVFNPQWTRKQTDAEMEANERKLQMIRDNSDMEIIFMGNEMHARKLEPEELARRAGQRMLVDAIRQEGNLENVLEIAVGEVVQSETVSDKSVDDDWITRFFDITKDINNEEMQYVWGKILAGEIRQPGSFSLRTLDIIKNIRKNEAEMFQSIIPLVLEDEQNCFILSDEELLKKYCINYDMLSVLNECGLITTEGGMLSISFEIQRVKNEAIYHRTGEIVISVEEDEKASLSFGIYTLTRAGKELYKILACASKEGYLESVAEKMLAARENANVKIEIIKK